MFALFYIFWGDIMGASKFLRNIGQPCLVELPTPTGVGFNWFVESGSTPVRVTPDISVQHLLRKRRQAFVLVACEPGDYELRFVLRRGLRPEVCDHHRVLLQVRKSCLRAVH